MQIVPSDRLEIFANLTYTQGSAWINQFDYDPGRLPVPIPGLDYALMSRSFSGFSDLRQRYVAAVAGANIRVSPRTVFNGTVEYRDYRDDAPYLFDTTGKRWTGLAGVTWLW